jgi:hypothetical protein
MRVFVIFLQMLQQFAFSLANITYTSELRSNISDNNEYYEFYTNAPPQYSILSFLMEPSKNNIRCA